MSSVIPRQSNIVSKENYNANWKKCKILSEDFFTLFSLINWRIFFCVRTSPEKETIKNDSHKYSGKNSLKNV